MRLMIKMFAGPVVLLLVGLVIMWEGLHLRDNKFIGMYSFIFLNASLVFAVGAVLWSAASVWKLVQSYRGNGELCHQCGGPTSYIEKGRYGPYFKCWRCGKNRAAR